MPKPHIQNDGSEVLPPEPKRGVFRDVFFPFRKLTIKHRQDGGVEIIMGGLRPFVLTAKDRFKLKGEL